jgi:3-hydroxybutyryl-CoA dehydrogenase
MVIRRITVLGAGTMGRGIAHAAAAAGYETAMFDVSPDALRQGRLAVEEVVRGSVDRGKVAAAEAEATLRRLIATSDCGQALADADLIIEAAPERIDIKIQVFADIDRLALPQAVVASNTSALSLTEMAATLANPSRVAGMHFFNPVHKMKLIEVVQALETSPATLDAVHQVATQMGKETVLVRESPGFITTRVNAGIGNEAFSMLMEGVASARDIDKALKLGLNHPMGPFELVDLVGLDTRLSILEYLHRSMGEKYRPCPLLVQYVKAGRLGRKVGRGVYEY